MSQLPSTQYNIPYNDPNDVGTIPYNNAAHQASSETYERELQQMQNLGFLNRDLNIVYLQRSRGNVQDAINFLLDLGE